MTLENYATELSGATSLQITIANANQQTKVAATCFSALGGKSQNPAMCYNPDFSQKMSVKKRTARGKFGETSLF